MASPPLDHPHGRLDVSHLPEYAHGPRSTLWWGVALMVAIESTVFVLSLASYFYIRQNYHVWPPTNPGPAPTRLGAIELAVLVASLLPFVLAARTAVRGFVLRARTWLLIGTVMGAVVLALRVFELEALARSFRWDSHAYGSIFWVTIGLHVFHIISSMGENVLLLALLFRGPVEKEHLVDLECNSFYWYFVVGWWAVIYTALYVGGAVFAT